MDRGANQRRVINIQVEIPDHERDLRVRFIMDDAETILVDLPLPVASRFTDQMMDAEFIQRQRVFHNSLQRIAVPATEVV